MNKDKEVSSIESALDFIDEYIKENAVQVRTDNENNKEDNKSNFRIIKQNKSNDVKEVEPDKKTKKNKDKKFVKKVDPETKIKKDIKNKYKDDQELNDLKKDERKIQRNDNFDGRVDKDGAFGNYTGSKFVSSKSDLYNDLSGKEAKRINAETKDKLDDDVKKGLEKDKAIAYSKYQNAKSKANENKSDRTFKKYLNDGEYEKDTPEYKKYMQDVKNAETKAKIKNDNLQKGKYKHTGVVNKLSMGKAAYTYKRANGDRKFIREKEES